MIDQIAKVNPAGVISVESVSERSPVLSQLSGRVVASVLSTSMIIVAITREKRRSIVEDEIVKIISS